MQISKGKYAFRIWGCNKAGAGLGRDIGQFSIGFELSCSIGSIGDPAISARLEKWYLLSIYSKGSGLRTNDGFPGFKVVRTRFRPSTGLREAGGLLVGHGGACWKALSR